MDTVRSTCFCAPEVVWSFGVFEGKKRCRLILGASFSIKIKEACLADDKRLEGEVEGEDSTSLLATQMKTNSIIIKKSPAEEGKRGKKMTEQYFD